MIEINVKAKKPEGYRSLYKFYDDYNYHTPKEIDKILQEMIAIKKEQLKMDVEMHAIKHVYNKVYGV